MQSRPRTGPVAEAVTGVCGHGSFSNLGSIVDLTSPRNGDAHAWKHGISIHPWRHKQGTDWKGNRVRGRTCKGRALSGFRSRGFGMGHVCSVWNMVHSQRGNPTKRPSKVTPTNCPAWVSMTHPTNSVWAPAQGWWCYVLGLGPRFTPSILVVLIRPGKLHFTPSYILV